MSLNTNSTNNTVARFARAGVAAAVAAFVLSGCASANTSDAANQSTHATTHESAVHVSEAWIKAAPKGMTSGFAQLQNMTDQEKSLVSVSSSVAGSVELHDMEGSGTSMSMKKLDGPLAIPAKSSVTLEPGAKHIMFMDLKQELKPGTTATLVFTYADHSTQEVDFEVKEFSGAKESYAPEADHSDHTEHMDH